MRDAGVPVIRCRGLVKRFGSTEAVAGLDLEVYRGEILVLVGPSGCGKTSTLRLIAGFETPDAGRIELAGRTVAGAGRPVPPEDRRVGFVFQEYALFPHLTVAENIAYGLPRGPERRRRVREMVELVRLEGLEDRYPHELSGGQQQRVALARALTPRPEILLLDEPFSNLDADLRQQVREEVREILRRTGITAVLVTHDRREALNLGDRVAVMNRGRVQQVGTPEAVYYRPATPFVAEFMGPATLLEGRVEPGGIATELGFFRQGVALAPGTAVRVLIRPDDVALQPLDGGGEGAAPGKEAAAGAAAAGARNRRGGAARKGPLLPAETDGGGAGGTASGAAIFAASRRGAPGIIVGRERRDGYYHYRVRLESGTVVSSELVHVHDYPVGTRVQVTVDAGHPLHWFPAGDGPADARSGEPPSGTMAAESRDRPGAESPRWGRVRRRTAGFGWLASWLDARPAVGAGFRDGDPTEASQDAIACAAAQERVASPGRRSRA